MAELPSQFGRVAAVISCESVSLDAFTGRLSAFNILDSFFCPKIPCILTRFTVLTLDDVGDAPLVYQERVRLVNESGANALENVLPIRVELQAYRPGSTAAGHRGIHSFWGIKILESTDHALIIERAVPDSGVWHEVARRRITIVAGPHPLMLPQVLPSSPVSPP